MARVRWWGTGVVALVLLVLCSGLALLNAALGKGGRPLAPGTVLSAGTERAGVRPVTFAVPSPGWALSEAGTSLMTGIELFNGDVVFNLNVVVPLGPMDAPRLWDGLDRIVEVGGRARLAAGPAPVTTAHGLQGLAGGITGRERAGLAGVFATPTLGATVRAAGPPGSYERVAHEVEAMVRTVRIRSPWP